ncbi:MAG: peroxide stress protein YaaA [Burkholderiaceae bacterium]|jgi:cytoplasmic iron level regulating protein YaaA (DUF328/UPF0246 family)|nr:peroxide stress protein YaaA [Burkholderiaceae bacterium]
MLLLLSPAKALDYQTPLPPRLLHSTPLFTAHSKELIVVLRAQTPAQIAALMHLSDALSELNVARYAAWRDRPAAHQTRQAVFAFNGAVYSGLDARSLSPADLDWAQTHVCILSGLYGVLRPLDLIQPHRLEMGTRLATARGGNLYQFWGERMAQYLNERLADDPAPVVINLASQEYAKAVKRQILRAQWVDCVFEERHANGRGTPWRIISVMAKRARGLMARYASQHRCTRPEDLQAFDLEGYAFDATASASDRLVFRRGERFA